MKHSAKRPPPGVLTEWLALANDDWSPDWDNFQNPQKGAVHRALLIEQGYVCAYCGRGLKADGGDSHIEHFWPRARYPGCALDYGNLYASCGPAAEKGASKTCGDAKGDWHDPGNQDLFPSHPRCEQRFRYGGNGQAAPFDGADALVGTMITVLNLNEGSLALERKAIIAALEEAILGGEIDVAGKAREIALWRALDGAGRAKSLGHVAAVYLEQEII